MPALRPPARRHVRAATGLAGGLAALLTGVHALPAQQGLGGGIDFPIYRPETPLLTLDQDRLYAESAFGRRVTADLEAATVELAGENRRIEAELIDEERALTAQRNGLSPEEFRALADAFDAKVVALRREQDAKGRALQRRDDLERQTFLQAALPILAELVADTGAVAILDERAVFFSSQSIDVTDRAIARIDAAIGDGAGLSALGPVAPAPEEAMPDEAGLNGAAPSEGSQPQTE